MPDLFFEGTGERLNQELVYAESKVCTRRGFFGRPEGQGITCTTGVQFFLFASRVLDPRRGKTLFHERANSFHEKQCQRSSAGLDRQAWHSEEFRAQGKRYAYRWRRRYRTALKQAMYSMNREGFFRRQWTKNPGVRILLTKKRPYYIVNLGAAPAMPPGTLCNQNGARDGVCCR